MRTDPDTSDLVATVRATLKAEVLPHLPPERRYAALMALNALAIAERQLADGAERRAAALAALALFAPGDTLDAAANALARGLRSGAVAPDAGLHAALTAATRQAVLESNPRARSLGEPAQENGSSG